MQGIDFRWIFDEPRSMTKPKVINYCSLTHWHRIVNGPVNRYNLADWLNRGPFRQFVKIVQWPSEKKFQCPANLVLKVLTQQVAIKNQPSDELWFSIDGALHRFGKLEFALITGLCFGKISKHDLVVKDVSLAEDNICNKLWPNPGRPITPMVIEALLNDMNIELARSDAKRLVLVLLAHWIFYGGRSDVSVSKFLCQLCHRQKYFRI